MENATENKTNRPVLPGVEELLNATRKVQTFALGIQESTNISVENVDACLASIDDMEGFLKDFFAGQSAMIETRAKTDMGNLQELVRVQTERMKDMRKVLEQSRKLFTEEEYLTPKPLKLPLSDTLQRLHGLGAEGEPEQLN